MLPTLATFVGNILNFCAFFLPSRNRFHVLPLWCLFIYFNDLIVTVLIKKGENRKYGNEYDHVTCLTLAALTKVQN